MYVYVVMQTAIQTYSSNEEHITVYAVAQTERRAQELADQCRAQTGGRFFAQVEEHRLEDYEGD